MSAFGDGEERPLGRMFWGTKLGPGDGGRVTYDPLENEGEVRSVAITQVGSGN